MRVVHCKKESYDVYIGRPSVFGNPYSVEKFGRSGCIEMYRAYATMKMSLDMSFRKEVKSLRGKTLGCWCAPKACHGDVLVELAEGTLFSQESNAEKII